MNRRSRVAASIALATAELGAATCCSPAPAPATIAHQGNASFGAEPLKAAPTMQAALNMTTTTEPPPTTIVVETPPPTTEPPPALELPEPEPEPVVTTAVTTPVTTRRTTTTVRRVVTTTVYEPPAPQGQSTRQGDAPLACIRSYEGDYGTNTGNGYYGAYQFDVATWRSVGGTGLPSDASPAEQDMRAQMLYDRRGLAPWPTPAAMCR